MADNEAAIESLLRQFELLTLYTSTKRSYVVHFHRAVFSATPIIKTHESLENHPLSRKLTLPLSILFFKCLF